MDLTGWEYIFTFGQPLEIYGKGNERVGIGKNTGDVILRYQV